MNDLRIVGDWAVQRSTLRGQRVPKAGGDPTPLAAVEPGDVLRLRSHPGAAAATPAPVIDQET